MRKITGLLLAVVILASCILTTAPYVFAADMTMSEQGMALLKAEEGFSKYPYWDYRQYTVGYGTKCPSDMVSHYKKYGITQEEAEVLLRNYMSGMEYTLNRYIEKYNLVLTQNQYDAIALFSYNVGTGWTTQTGGTFFHAITGGATGNTLIRAFGLWCKADGEVKDFLLRRRMSEANLYLNGVYSQQPPESYGYVIYNGNGGNISHSAQVFDSSVPMPFDCTAVLEGYTFLGWFTAQTGGNRVTVLDAAAKGLFLHAQWLPDAVMPYYTDTVDVSVVLTANGVNMRSGPGSNYDVLGIAYRGEPLLITETVQDGELLWGRSDKGWIALKFTDFDDVYAALPPEAFLPPATEPPVTEPPATEPPATEPPATEPPVTEPPVTEPPATEPPATEPPTTEPPVTEPPATEPPATEPPVTQWEGKVTASKLNIRKTPGGQYLGYYVRGTKVTILEKQTVNGTEWGKTDKGWISMDYVELTESEPPATEPPVTEPPATEPPATEPPATEPPVTEPPVTQWEGKVTASKLNIRKTPGGRYLGYYVRGTKVTILEKQTVNGTEWGKTDKGWISMDYVELTESEPPATEPPVTEPPVTEPPVTEPPVTEPPVTQWEGKVTASKLNIRKTPGGQYLGYYVRSTKVVILEKQTVNGIEWGKTDKGWISMDYVELAAPPVTQWEGKVTASTLNIRKTPGGQYLGYYVRGTKVTILEKQTVNGTEWGKTDKGWISLDYVK